MTESTDRPPELPWRYRFWWRLTSWWWRLRYRAAPTDGGEDELVPRPPDGSATLSQDDR